MEPGGRVISPFVAAIGDEAALARIGRAHHNDMTRVCFLDCGHLGRSVDDLVAFVEGNPARIVHHSQPVTIGGHTGRLFDIDIAHTWTMTCPD